MEKRRLGRVDHESTVVTFGAISVGRQDLSQRTADQVIELALEHGLNHIDVAPSYGQAMERLASWMPRIRDHIFLGAKTTKRTEQEAWEEIRSCQQRLGVDRFDLFQLHGVTSMEELNAVTQAGGALEALIEMREQGLTRYIGITGHGPDAPRVHLAALERFDFDTVMFPLAAVMYRNPAYRRDAEALLAMARERNIGVQTIKLMARGGWGDRERETNTWYDPHREQTDIDKAVCWTLSQPVHTAPSSSDAALLPKILDAAERFRPLSQEEQEEIVATLQPPLPEPRLGIPSAA